MVAPRAQGQASAIAGAAATQPQDVGLRPGVPIPSGVGVFADPSTMHGLTLGLQAGLGTSTKSAAFGFDNLAVSARWVPGTNRLGRRLGLLAGVADWRIPALRDVYPAFALTGVGTSDTLGARSDARASVGIEWTFAGGRSPEPNDPLWGNSKRGLKHTLDSLRVLAIRAADNPLEQSRLGRVADSLKWTEFLRPVSRRGVSQVGVLTRVDALTTESDLTALDTYLATSRGHGLFDFSSAVHYLTYREHRQVPRDAVMLAAGGFWDLADMPPAPVLGLSAGVGRYRYRSLNTVTDGALSSTLAPHTQRYDVVLSLSGAPDKSGGNTAGIGLRYSRLVNSDVSSHDQFALLISTNFRLLASGTP